MSSVSLFAFIEFLGRAMVASLYFFGATRKLMAPALTKKQIKDAGIPMAGVAYPIVLCVELLGGLGLVVGYRVSEAAAALAAFTLVIAVTMHRNWADRATLNLFLLDITIIGGLLVICGHGAGPISLASWLR